MFGVFVPIQRFSDQSSSKRLSHEEMGIANLLATITGYEEEIVKIQQEFIEPVKKRLASGTFRWMETLALGPDNLTASDDQKVLDKINNVDLKLLSSHDLKIKLAFHMREINRLQQEIHALRMKILELEHAVQSKRDAEMRLQSSKRNALYIDGFKEDPVQFFASIASTDEKVSSRPDSAALFINAEKIIATCDMFDSSIPPFNLWMAWEVVDRARRAAEEQYA